MGCLCDWDAYAAHFALSPEGQAEVARRVREEMERIAAKQAAIEAKRVAHEIERVKKENREGIKSSSRSKTQGASTPSTRRTRRVPGTADWPRLWSAVASGWRDSRAPAEGSACKWHCVWDQFCHSIYA